MTTSTTLTAYPQLLGDTLRLVDEQLSRSQTRKKRFGFAAYRVVDRMRPYIANENAAPAGTVVSNKALTQMNEVYNVLVSRYPSTPEQVRPFIKEGIDLLDRLLSYAEVESYFTDVDPALETFRMLKSEDYDESSLPLMLRLASAG